MKLIEEGYYKVYLWDDSLYYVVGPCKNNYRIIPKEDYTPSLVIEQQQPLVAPLITIHGNVQYEYLYRSSIDTPFAQKNFSQHTLQTSIDLNFRNAYPVHVSFVARKSNSPYFDNITDVNFQFNQQAFLDKIKDRLKRNLPEVNPEQFLQKQAQLQQKKMEVQDLRSWLSDPARIEEMVKQKEAMLRDKAGVHLPDVEQTAASYGRSYVESKLRNAKDSLSSIADSSTVLQKIEKKQKELEEAEAEVRKLENELRSGGKHLEDSLDRIRQKIAQIKNPEELKNFLADHDMDSKNLPAGWKHLMNLKSIGIGRSWIDYSELTVKNISLTGVNVEVTPAPFYFAAAAGKVNYAFRDFIVKNRGNTKQNLWLLRGGLGSREKNNIIFTYYDGRKALLNAFNDTLSGNIAPEHVIGFSIENRLALDANNYVTFEVARSSFQTVSASSQTSDELMKKVWDLKNHSNEAYAIKLNSYLPTSLTTINGFYKKMGAHFQSFNLQPANVGQESYEAKVRQGFWKQKLSIEVGIRKNVFSNPFINPGLNSNTVFKSFQASLRVPKYPFITVGYYPSSQLTILDNNVLVENQYNTLSMVGSHSYSTRSLNMNTTAMYLKFYNHNSDTGFIYFNASSFSVSQNIYWNKFQFQTSASFIEQQYLDVYTLEQSASVQCNHWLSLGGGLKYDRIKNTQTLWGASLDAGINIKPVGLIQLNYDKSYLPGSQKNLLPIETGRVSLYRNF